MSKRKRQEIDWCSDHAASGWRVRAWLALGELLVYDNGDWEVRLDRAQGQTVAGDKEPNQEAGKTMAIKVYLSLTGGSPSERGPKDKHMKRKIAQKIAHEQK